MKRVVALLATVAMVLGGCGLPDSTEPKYVGPAAAPSRAQGRAEEPLKPDGITSLIALVNSYLKTSVGGNIASADQPDAVSETQVRMKTFMTKEAAATWPPRPQVAPAPPVPLLVVDASLTPSPPDDKGKIVVQAHFVRVGQLDRFGRLLTGQNDPTWERGLDFDFEGEQVGGQLLLSKVPPFMLLSTEGLASYYTRQPIYFWETDVEAPKLVPDLRYMPNVLPASKKISEVVQWLVDGPSLWLTLVADRPSILETKGSPTLRDDGSVEVNLTAKVAGKSADDLRRLAHQIRWSLPGHPPVSFSFENAKDATNFSDGYLDQNAAVVPGEPDLERFAVVNGSVRQLPSTSGREAPALFGPSEWNKGVVSATINRARTRAALVRTVGTKQQLFVNAGTGEPKYVEVPGVVGAALSRPVWIDRPEPRFLITNGATLWAVPPPGSGGEAPLPVVVPGLNGQELTNVSAFAVAPDGRRVALVVGGKAMVAPLRFENGNLMLGEQRAVPTTLGGNNAIGWITETTLAIGGTPNPTNTRAPGTYSMVWTSVDGTGERTLPLNPDPPAVTVTQLSARANDPTSRSPEQVFVVLEDMQQQAKAVFADSVGDILRDSPGDATPSPSASQPPKLVARSPFYAD
ncbi:LpqB family beta-propeller domain-containing protein [Dactylosporangium sp. NPDC000521]|uniref:LpqB family beta-propeller domain-containing protein n=1 Tax=Dactylosporangium sp. NPDC000521 TaxID=3363975 RepID=UPI0036A60125